MFEITIACMAIAILSSLLVAIQTYRLHSVREYLGIVDRLLDKYLKRHNSVNNLCKESLDEGLLFVRITNVLECMLETAEEKEVKVLDQSPFNHHTLFMGNNTASVICQSCSEPAFEYDSEVTAASSLDGKICVCQSCTAIGRISYDYEFERASVGFFPLSKKQLSHVDFATLVEAYEAAQEKINDLMDEIVRLRMEKK